LTLEPTRLFGAFYLDAFYAFGYDITTRGDPS